MLFDEIKEKLEKNDQTQLLKFYDELNSEEQKMLLQEIERIDFNLFAADEPEVKDEVITPIEATTMDEIRDNYDRYEKAGIEGIQSNKLACVLLAGGQGTRLGIDGPKGAYNIGETRDIFIFECLFNNLIKVVEKAGKWIPLYIMTSDKNDEETRTFIKSHKYFGYNEEYVTFFIQEMAPATDFNKKVLLEGKGHVSFSPNGNGGWFYSLEKCGLKDKIKKDGAKWLNVFAVDNVLQKMADPVFFGATLLSGKPQGSKVVRKTSPDEKVGVMCYRDGKPSIVEYYDLSEDMANEKNEKGDRAYNFGVILNYLFSIEALEEISRKNLPLHVVKKKVPYVDSNGNFVKPEEINGYKYEKLVLDMIEMMDGCLVFEVDRSKEFAPIKNRYGTDSVDTAKEMLKANGVEL